MYDPWLIDDYWSDIDGDENGVVGVEDGTIDGVSLSSPVFVVLVEYDRCWCWRGLID